MTDTQLLIWFIDRTVADAKALYPHDPADRKSYIAINIEYLVRDMRRNPDFTVDHLRWLHGRERQEVAS